MVTELREDKSHPRILDVHPGHLSPASPSRPCPSAPSPKTENFSYSLLMGSDLPCDGMLVSAAPENHEMREGVKT